MSLKIRGVSRLTDDSHVLMLHFDRRPTDDDLREIHDKDATIDRLTRELAESNAHFRELLLTNGSMGERNIGLSIQNDRLRAALERYGVHDDDCDLKPRTDTSCACGMLNALRGEK